MSRTRRRSFEPRRAARCLAWALLLALTGCDQFFPYDKEPVQVCGVADTVSTADSVGIGTAQLCRTDWVRATPPAPTCTTDTECAEAYPGTNGDPISETNPR